MAQAVPTPRRVTPVRSSASIRTSDPTSLDTRTRAASGTTSSWARLRGSGWTARPGARALAIALCWTLGSPAHASQSPAAASSAPTKPTPTQPDSTQPGPTGPAPTQPTPTGPAPAQPGPTKPAPTEPLPFAEVDPEISDPQPAGSEHPAEGDNVAVIARAGLEVDTATAGPNGPVMLTRLEELGNLELRRAEVLPRRHIDDPVIHLRLELRNGEAEAYAIFSDVRVRGEPIEGSAREVQCPLCTEGEAVERARSELVRLVPFVRARFRPTKKPDQTRPIPQPAPPSPGLGTLGKTGVGLLVGGTAVFAAGLGLAIAKPPANPDNPLVVQPTRPVGYALVGVGASALISGAVLLILDRRKQRRVVQLAPLMRPGTAGLLLVGRF